jgi:hypothetical protein
MKCPFWPLQVALKARIQGETNYSLHDDHPEQKKYPYIILGHIGGGDWSDKSKSGQNVTATIDFWSQYQGKKEVAQMMDEVIRAIDYPWIPNLSPDFNVVHHWLDFNEIISDLDPRTYHGILKWIYLIEEI